MTTKRKHNLPQKRRNLELDSALRTACVHDSPELIGALAELGADLHCADDSDFTPLHIAARANKGRACAELIRRSSPRRRAVIVGGRICQRDATAL